MIKVHNPAAGNHWKSQGLEFHVNEFGNILRQTKDSFRKVMPKISALVIGLLKNYNFVGVKFY